MTTYRNPNDNRETVWLTVSYSMIANGYFIERHYPPFINHRDVKEFHKVEGKSIVYMVRGFVSQADAREFAIDYHEAKRDGFVSRVGLD